jgi:hypothetical protein
MRPPPQAPVASVPSPVLPALGRARCRPCATVLDAVEYGRHPSHLGLPAFARSGLASWRDRKFESTSLQRRVCCEPRCKLATGRAAGQSPGRSFSRGPPDGQVFFASLAGNYLGQIDLETGGVTVLEPPVSRQGLDGSGATVTAPSGSPAGTVATCSATTARPSPGRAGACLATGRNRTPSMSTRPIWCGSATGA